MSKKIALILFTLLVQGCVAVKYNGSETFVKNISFPNEGTTVTAYVGDALVQKGIIVEEEVLVIKEDINQRYIVPKGQYKKLGEDNTNIFYSAEGVGKVYWTAFPSALAIDKKYPEKLYVIASDGFPVLLEGKPNYEHGRAQSTRESSFQQTLLYSGRIGDKINISYREFSNNKARPAFNNDVEYDLSVSNEIGYKGALLEVIKADNRRITYKLISNFPD